MGFATAIEAYRGDADLTVDIGSGHFCQHAARRDAHSSLQERSTGPAIHRNLLDSLKSRTAPSFGLIKANKFGQPPITLI